MTIEFYHSNNLFQPRAFPFSDHLVSKNIRRLRLVRLYAMYVYKPCENPFIHPDRHDARWRSLTQAHRPPSVQTPPALRPDNLRKRPERTFVPVSVSFRLAALVDTVIVIVTVSD